MSWTYTLLDRITFFKGMGKSREDLLLSVDVTRKAIFIHCGGKGRFMGVAW